MAERASVGLVGIGLLGQALAHRLLGAGFEVAGFDVDPAKNAKLAELGGRPATSVAYLAERCDPIVLAVFTTDQVEQVVERELLPVLGDGSGRIVLCASTCDPDRIAALGGRVAARGLRFLETPVSGSSGQVSRGEGVGLIGGDPRGRGRGRAGAARAVPDLFPHRQGRRRRPRQARRQPHPRPQPSGAGRGPGLRRAARARSRGLSRGRARLGRLFAGHGHQGPEDDRAATSPPKAACTQHLKDVHLMLEQAARAGQRLPLLEVHADVLEACVRRARAMGQQRGHRGDPRRTMRSLGVSRARACADEEFRPGYGDQPMSDGEVRYARDGAVATVIFDRPAARNAMTWRMYEQLGEACARIARRGRAAGRGVSRRRRQGLHRRHRHRPVPGVPQRRGRHRLRGEDGRLPRGLEALPVPTLAVVEGFAIGGGLAIAAACDLRIATPGARFGVPIARTLGNCLSIANYARLVAALGASRAKRVLLLAENLTAEEALAGGFLSEIVAARRPRPARRRAHRPSCAPCAYHHAGEQGGDPPAPACRPAGRRRPRARLLRQRRLPPRRERVRGEDASRNGPASRTRRQRDGPLRQADRHGFFRRKCVTGSPQKTRQGRDKTS